MKKAIALILALTMCLSLCACGKAGDYESAAALLEAGNYEEAIAAFSELGDYEDSVQKLEECKNIKAYDEANALFGAEKFDEALAIFSTLGNYKDSVDKAKECENAIAYENALNLLNSGEYEQAYEALCALGEYKDVAELLTHFVEVEITPENWENYFAVVTVPQYTKNDFDEITDISFTHNLELKEEITGCIFNTAESKVAFEFHFITAPKDVQFDKSSGEYEILPATFFDFEEEYTKTLTWGSQESDKVEIHQSLKMMQAPEVGQEPPSDWFIAENFEVIRAKGSIFIYE